MPLAPPPIIDVTAPRSISLPEKQILWPTYLGHGDDGGSDARAFPRLDAIKARRATIPPAALDAFVEATWSARERILILDDYLFQPLGAQPVGSRYDQVEQWFPNGLAANEVRLLTNSLASADEQEAVQRIFDRRAASINESSPRRLGEVNIQIRFTLGSRFPYVHDRFAVIDDELWHFGATVGGLHNQVNAATRGWDARDHDAIRFFSDAWNGDGDAGGRWRRT